MAIVPVVATYGSLIDMEEIGNSRESMLNLLKSQKALFHSQVNEFHRIVNHQCKLTGTNPLAQEMAANSLGYKTGKKVKDSLNPKALKYLQSIFSIKDTTGKKETREISALCRITVTQVRDFFNAERSKVKKLVQKSERIASDVSKAIAVGCSTPNQTQSSAKNEFVTNITPNSTIVENGTSCSSNQGIVTSVSSQSPSTPENVNLLSTESVGSSSSVIQGCTWDFEKSGNVILPWDSEIHGNSQYSQTEHMQILGNLEEGFQDNVGNFNDLYTPLSWCPGNSNNCSTNMMKVSTSFPNVSTDISNVNSNTSNLSRNISNISTAAVSTTVANGVDVFENNVNASSVQDGQFSINTDTTHVEEGSTHGVDSSDKEFIERIFSMMRKEQTFAGRVKLMEWVLQIQNKAVLTWFSTKGGIAILASWLNDAVLEEQTTVLSVIFKVFCHMPLEKAQPLQMSGILQTVNKLRFYRNPDISKRAKVLLSSWSKMVVRAQALKNARNRLKNGPLTKRKNGALYDKLNLDIPEEIYAFAQDAEDHRGTEPEPGNGLKLLTNDTSSKKQELFISAKKIKERRKVQLVEHPDSKLGRNTTIAKVTSSNQSRPLSADDIKKAKMRAMYMQEKHGKAYSPTENGQLNDGNTPTAVRKPSPHNQTPSTSNAPQPSRLRINEITNPQERLMEKLLRVQIQWCRPPEFVLNSSWQVCSGENSKEVHNQNKRTQREQEAIYRSAQEIPRNPKEPWDSEIDYDDTLTPVIPIDPPLEANSPSDAAITEQADVLANSMEPAAPDFTKADPELLQVLLKNPQLVEVLTRQGHNLSQEQLVALLELVKKSDSSPPAPISRPISAPRSISIPRPEFEAQHCSLPSPTPPSDATRNSRRSEFTTQNLTSQLAQSRDVPVGHAAPTTSQYMKLPISNNQAQYVVPNAVSTNNHIISQNMDYVTQHQQPPPPVNVVYQPTNALTSSNYYQANNHTRIVQKQYMQYPPEQSPQPAVPDYSRREFTQGPNQVVAADDRLNHLNYYHANPNNANNANSLNMYSRTNEYAPRVGPPEMYGQGKGYDQCAPNYGNRTGEKRPRDPHFR